MNFIKNVIYSYLLFICSRVFFFFLSRDITAQTLVFQSRDVLWFILDGIHHNQFLNRAGASSGLMGNNQCQHKQCVFPCVLLQLSVRLLNHLKLCILSCCCSGYAYENIIVHRFVLHIHAFSETHTDVRVEDDICKHYSYLCLSTCCQGLDI